MKININPLKPILALSLLAGQTVLAFDPLLDEPEPFADWRVSKEISYTASNTPTWEAGSWIGASKELDLAASSLNLDASLGFLADDFQVDSAWNIEPKASATWSKGRLSVEGWGWGNWSDLGWIDEGAGSDISWQLTDSVAKDATWTAGIHGWISDKSGSAAGVKLTRNSKGEAWSTNLGLTARRLWDVEATQQRPGGVQRTRSATTTTDQWQVLLESGVDRNWESVSAGVGLDLDLRMSDASDMSSANSMGKGRMTSSSSSYQYSGTLDPYANLSWTPGSWSFTVTSGWNTEIQRTKGAVQPTATFWTSMSASKSW